MSVLLLAIQNAFVVSHDGVVHSGCDPVCILTAEEHIPLPENHEDTEHWHLASLLIEAASSGDFFESSDASPASDLTDMLDPLHEYSFRTGLLHFVDSALDRKSHEYPQTLLRPPITTL